MQDLETCEWKFGRLATLAGIRHSLRCLPTSKSLAILFNLAAGKEFTNHMNRVNPRKLFIVLWDN